MGIKGIVKRRSAMLRKHRGAFFRNIRYIWTKRWLRWTILPPFVFGLVIIATLVLSSAMFEPIRPYNFGVSFSIKRANELGLDWRKNYTALLDDLGIRHFRLMSYWDQHEPVRGDMDFSSLDWQMDQAAAKGAKVSLAIGLRQPRWPECHEPEWARALSGHEWKQALYAYMEAVIKRYENHPALASWQLENEYFNNYFGICSHPDRQRFEEEFALVETLSDKPILASLANQHGLPVRGPRPDSYGYSIYRYVYNDKILPGYIWYPTPLWYHRLRSVVIKATTDRELFVHELQLEPWGPYDTRYLSIREQNKTMSNDQIHKNVTFARQVGLEDIYSWGGEWWYWRLVQYGDPSVWETVRREIQISNDRR